MQRLDAGQLEKLFALYEPLDGVRANLVANFDGSVAGESGSSNDVSNTTDRALLATIRSLSDVIVTSATTARAEQLRPSKFAPMVVLCNSANLVGLEILLTSSSNWVPMLFVPKGLKDRAQAFLNGAGLSANLVELSDLSPKCVVDYLREQGYSKILFEAGPTLLKLWLRAGMINELCLTTTSASSDRDAKSSQPEFVRQLSEERTIESVSDFYAESIETRFQQIKFL